MIQIITWWGSVPENYHCIIKKNSIRNAWCDGRGTLSRQNLFFVSIACTLIQIICNIYLHHQLSNRLILMTNAGGKKENTVPVHQLAGNLGNNGLLFFFQREKNHLSDPAEKFSQCSNMPFCSVWWWLSSSGCKSKVTAAGRVLRGQNGKLGSHIR